MKFIITTLVLAFSLQTIAMDETRTSCPKTRPCKEDKDCRIYAFKHNCHAQCKTVTLKFADNKSEVCRPQCLCLKKVKLINA